MGGRSYKFTKFFQLPLHWNRGGNVEGDLHNRLAERIDEVLENAVGAYAGRFEQGSIPTPAQIPDGKWGIWIDDVNGGTYIVVNEADVMYLNAFLASGSAVTWGIITMLTAPQTTTSSTFVLLATQYVDAARLNVTGLIAEFIQRTVGLVSAAGVEGEIRIYDVTNAVQLALATYVETVPTLKSVNGAVNLPTSGIIQIELQYRRSVGAGANSFTVNFANVDHALKLP
jgi:hypothetical protein